MSESLITTVDRALPTTFLSALGLWTLIAAGYVVVDQGWGAVCVAGIGSVIVNSAAAAGGVIYVLVMSIREQRFRGLQLAVSVFAPVASAAIIFGAFYVAKFN